jgi:hypothetical protein
MRPRFTRWVAIDWSGARLPSAQRRAIARCVIEGNEGDRRVTLLEAGCDRRETVTWVAARAAEEGPTLVGLDFPFAYAIPFLDHIGAPDFSALLARMAPLDDAPAGPALGEAFIGRCGRWWTRWGRRRDARTRRRVERLPATRGAESPLRALPHGRGHRFVGPRQVGKATITGLAAIAAVKARVPTARVWPFEDPADASLVLVEIWPRLALPGVVKSVPAARRRHVRALGQHAVRIGSAERRIAAASDHGIDALAAAVAMASEQWRLPDRRTLPPEAAREGWILGVPPPRRGGGLSR